MSRVDLRPWFAVVMATAVLAYVGCNSSNSTSKTGPATNSVTSKAASAPTPSVGSGKSTKQLADWPTPEAVLVISGEMDGYLEPCGCTQGQYGGLIRRYDFVERLRAQNWPVVLIDLGSLVKEPAAARGGFDQAKLKFNVALKALCTLKYHAIALSAEDLKIGVGEALVSFINNLTDPTRIVTANVEPVSGSGFENQIRPSLVMNAGSLKIGVTSIVDPERIAKLSDPDKELMLPVVKRPDDVLPAVLADLESRSNYQVLMVQGPPEMAKRMAQAYPGFDVVVSTSLFPDPEADAQQVNGGKTLIVEVGRRGKFVGALGFFADEAKRMRYQRITLSDRYNGPATAMKKVIEDDFRKDLKDARFVETFPKHDYVNGTTGASFIGAETCKRCHPNTFMKWSTTKHAQAFEALRHDPKPNTMFDAECVTCHTTGFEYNSGFVSEEKTPGLRGNQCENCHGPGSKHASEPTNLAFRSSMKLTAEQADKNRLCLRCHDEDNSPKFNFTQYWSQVSHKGLDTYTDPSVLRGVTPNVARKPTESQGK